MTAVAAGCWAAEVAGRATVSNGSAGSVTVSVSCMAGGEASLTDVGGGH